MVLSTSKPGYFGKGSAEISAPASDTEGGVRRLAICADKLVTQPFEGLDVLPDVLDYAARTHGSRPLVGYRDVVDIVTEKKEVKKTVGGKEVTEMKEWKYFQLSPYRFWSAIEFRERVGRVARGLISLGLTKDTVFNLYANTRFVHPHALVAKLTVC